MSKIITYNIRRKINLQLCCYAGGSEIIIVNTEQGHRIQLSVQLHECILIVSRAEMEQKQLQRFFRICK